MIISHGVALASGLLALAASAGEGEPAFEILNSIVPLSIEIRAEDERCQVNGDPVFGAVIAALEDEGVEWTRFSETEPDHRLRVYIALDAAGDTGPCAGYLLGSFEQFTQVTLPYTPRPHEGFLTLIQYDAGLGVFEAGDEAQLTGHTADSVYHQMVHAIRLARSMGEAAQD